MTIPLLSYGTHFSFGGGYVMKHNTKKLVLSGLFLAIGLVLPFLTGQIPEISNMISPMHFPVLLCGFICGAPYGALVGLILPPVRFLLFPMPSIAASAHSFPLLPDSSHRKQQPFPHGQSAPA